MRRALTAAAVLPVALSLGLAPDIAFAGTKAGSTVTVTRAVSVDGGVSISGKVTSSADNCKKRRTVDVYHDVAPPGPSAEDFYLGTAKTSKRGKWRLSTPYAPDKVYASVRANDDCKGDTSSTKTVAA